MLGVFCTASLQGYAEEFASEAPQDHLAIHKRAHVSDGRVYAQRRARGRKPLRQLEVSAET